MWLTRNHIFICEILGKSTSFVFWNFEISLVSPRRFQNFKKVNSINLSQISLLNMWLQEKVSSTPLLRVSKLYILNNGELPLQVPLTEGRKLLMNENEIDSFYFIQWLLWYDCLLFKVCLVIVHQLFMGYGGVFWRIKVTWHFSKF